MSGSARNLRVADWCYRYIQEKGPQTVSELVEFLNHQRMNYPNDKWRIHRGKGMVTSHQISGVLRTSPLFKAIGSATILYPQWGRTPKGKSGWMPAEANTVRGEVLVYDIVSITSVVDKILSKQHALRKHYPKVIKDEMKRREATQ